MRKYTNLFVKFQITPQLLDILKSTGSSIKSLRLCHVHGSLDDLKQVIELCENAKEVWILEGEFEGQADAISERNFKKIFICNKDLQIFSLLRDCQTKFLEVSYIRELESNDFDHFLTNQVALSELAVTNTSADLLKNITALNVDHLKLLNVTELPAITSKPQTFSASLKKLTIQSPTVSEVTPIVLPTVTELNMRSRNLRVDHQLTNLTHLKLEFDNFSNDDWMKFLPSVESLKIVQYSNSTKAFQAIDLDVKELKHLKHLEVCDKFIWLVMGGMTSLFLTNVRLKSPLFLSSNNKIEYLRIDECRWVNDAFFEHVIESCVNLKTLIVTRANISTKIVEKFHKNCKNLKCFQLINCTVT